MKTNNLLALTFIIIGGFTFKAKAQDCSKMFWDYYKLTEKKQYNEAYPLWEKMYNANCTTYEYYENMLADGVIILEEKIKAATSKQDSTKYGAQVASIMDKRIAASPNEKLYWSGEKTHAEYIYKIITPKQAYDKYEELFVEIKDKKGVELSASAALDYYGIGVTLLNEKVITFEEFTKAYFDNQKVVKENAEIRKRKYGLLVEKEDSLAALTPPKKLTPEENDSKETLNRFGKYFDDIALGLQSSYAENVTCDNLGPMFTRQFEEKKDDEEWLAYAHWALNEQGCQDSQAFATILDRRIELQPQPTAGSTGGSTVSGGSASPGDLAFYEGVKLFKQKNYNGAISKLKEAVNAGGANAGHAAYYAAESYRVTGSSANAISWYNKAAKLKPGWGSPYIQIARIFGDKNTVNSCGSDSVQKLAAYLVAADYMNKACRVDPSSCNKSVENQYRAAGPTANDIFNSNGKYKKGQRISIGCHGGASTTL